jgi:hypothetical protein
LRRGAEGDEEGKKGAVGLGRSGEDGGGEAGVEFLTGAV